MVNVEKECNRTSRVIAVCMGPDDLSAPLTCLQLSLPRPSAHVYRVIQRRERRSWPSGTGVRLMWKRNATKHREQLLYVWGPMISLHLWHVSSCPCLGPGPMSIELFDEGGGCLGRAASGTGVWTEQWNHYLTSTACFSAATPQGILYAWMGIVRTRSFVLHVWMEIVRTRLIYSSIHTVTYTEGLSLSEAPTFPLHSSLPNTSVPPMANRKSSKSTSKRKDTNVPLPGGALQTTFAVDREWLCDLYSLSSTIF